MGRQRRVQVPLGRVAAPAGQVPSLPGLTRHLLHRDASPSPGASNEVAGATA